MASVRARAKRHALIKKSAWENNIPEFDKKKESVTLYTLKLGNALNDVDKAQRQKFVIQYWDIQKKDTENFTKVSEFYFYSAALLIMLEKKGIPMTPENKTRLDAIYNDVKSRVPVEKREKKVTANVRDNTEDLAKKIAAEIDGAIDDFYATGTKMDIKKYLIQAKASAPVCKMIADFYKGQLSELKEAQAGKDEQLNEGYSHLAKRAMKNIIAYVESAVNDSLQMSAIAKVARKPRKRKEKAPSVIAKRVAYLGVYDPLQLKSIHPEKVVGASQVWVFNTKYRKLYKYEALDGMTLTWKGTTLQNFDPTKSGGKTIRKPEAFMKDAVDTTKRRLERLFDEVRGVLAKATGRLNNETLIVRVF